jgi:hypothetical protein
MLSSVVGAALLFVVVVLFVIPIVIGLWQDG